MAQRTDNARSDGRVIDGFPLGNRQATGDPDGWFVARDGERGGLVKLPPRGTVRGNWDALERDDADGW